MTHTVAHWLRIRTRSVLRACCLVSTATVMIVAMGILALAQNVNAQESRTFGALTIRLGGVPTGTSADVTITASSTGPPRVLHLSGTGEMSVKLEPGMYVITGLAIPGYSAPPAQRVTIVAGQPSTVILTYTAPPGVQPPGVQAPGVQAPGVQPLGALTIRLSGLAAGSTVDVIIGDASTGAKKVLRVSSAGETMGRLEPGIYTVGGAAVSGYSAPPSPEGHGHRGSALDRDANVHGDAWSTDSSSTRTRRTDGQVERATRRNVSGHHHHIADRSKENARPVGRRPDVRQC